ncbi:hypothetical protein [Lihuaxuella thermophila]|uniref:Uncharacterized protein n=1 Tax=Lihuaxuella thermophila TaxID=1173111 RepID=A0A1H8HBM0_9BACL|nr:hypothetical protein [Lihuaxuella thermophila]SEN53434.1 hypothetical protein SAMN05444955_113126 [Lihuaxuella thermophila]SEN78159.1 hypothetical protein SAMN05444955_12333 [Lihuaxuella thermophila]SEN80408.1 hypothetical protein SAMN05444955_1269 [Lihuaxuella thermophila]
MKKAIQRRLKSLGRWEVIQIGNYVIQRYSQFYSYICYDAHTGRNLGGGSLGLISHKLKDLIKQDKRPIKQADFLHSL